MRESPLWLRAFLFFLSYLAGSILSTRLTFHGEEVVAFWPPSGLLLGMLLVSRVAEWPAFLAGATLASLAFEGGIHHHNLWLSVAFGCSNFLEAAAGAWLLRLWCGRCPHLDRVRDVLRLALVSAGLPLLGATSGLATMVYFHPEVEFWRLWPLWWRADSIGLLIFTPLVISWSGPASRAGAGREAERPFFLESLLYFLGVVLTAIPAFGLAHFLPHGDPYPYLTFPVLLWGAMRLRPKALTLGLVLLAVVAAAATINNHAMPDASSAGLLHILAHLQGFLFVCQLCALLPAAVVAHRRVVEAKVKSLNESLEARVAARTAELEESRSLHRELTSVSPVGIFRADANKKIVFVNEKWSAITGMDQQTALGDGWIEAVHPEDRRWVLKGWQRRASAGENDAVDFRFLTPAGKSVWVMSQFVMQLRDGMVEGYVGSVTDISQRKEAEMLLQASRDQLEEGIRQRTRDLSERNEELKCRIAESERISRELQESDSTLRGFFESAPMMMGIVEVTGDDILFVSLNSSAPGFIRSDAKSAQGRTAMDLGWSGEEVELWIASFRESERQRQPQRLRLRRGREGQERDFDTAVAFLGHTAAGRSRYCYVADDVTETVQAHNQQERFKSILEATTDVVGMADRFGRLFYMNQAGRKLLGLKADEPLGERKLPEVHVPWAANLVAREGLPLAMLEGTWRGETAVRDQYGGELPASELILAHKTPEGTVDFVSAIIRDMSEQKEAEALVTASLEEKVVLLKEIHHRVKNNLQIVSSLLQLQSSYIKDPESLKIFEESRDRIKSMALIHEQLYQSNDLAKIDFPEYLRSLLSMVLSANRSKETRIDTRVHVDPVSLDLDTAIPVGLITNELVTNSLKYAFAGRPTGEISLRLSALGPEEFSLCIADNGVGLPKNFSFQKANSLGLRLVRILTKQMRGSLEVVNGAGTEFHIKFKTGAHHE